MKKIFRKNKRGFSLAWDNLGLFVLATIVILVLLFLIFKFGKTGNGFLGMLGDMF